MYKSRLCSILLLTLLAPALVFPAPAQTQPSPHSASASSITIRVGKAGLFSGLGHNHVVVAPVAHGNVGTKDMTVEIVVVTAQMKVTDAEVSEKDRAEIQKTMLGPTVLDAAKFPEVRFQSSRVEQTSPGHFRVMGTLSLHGVNKPLVFEVTESQKRYRGKTKFLQTAFGIQPVKAGGGAVKVKDELELEFDIDPADLNAAKR